MAAVCRLCPVRWKGFDQNRAPGHAIIDAETFDAVQRQLDANIRRHDQSRNQVARAPLAGRIFDAEGEPMCPATAYGKTGKLYRYYVSAPLQQGRAGKKPRNDGIIRRVAAAPLEAKLAETIRRLIRSRNDDPLFLPNRIEIHTDHVELLLPIRHLDIIQRHLEDNEHARPDHADISRLRLSVPVRAVVRGGRTHITGGKQPPSKPDPTLIKALRTAHAMLEPDDSGAPVLASAPTSPWRRKLVRLAFLAPDLQQAIFAGRQPANLTLTRLMESDMPLSWNEQRRCFGLSDAH